MIERPPPPPDAGISLLGIYGLANPTIVWLLNKRPDLLAETPAEFGANIGGSERPACDYWYEPIPRYDGPAVDEREAEDLEAELAKIGRPGSGPIGVIRMVKHCQDRMSFRYVHGRPAWVCFAHSGDDETYGYHYRFIPRPPAKLTQEPTFDLWAEIGRALEGKSRDLVFDEGKWRLVDV